jgi:type II secretory pathway component PulC
VIETIAEPLAAKEPHPSEKLMDEFGIQEDDVFTYVGSTALDSAANIAAVLGAIPNQDSWTITVRRRNGSTWDTYTYSLTEN